MKRWAQLRASFAWICRGADWEAKSPVCEYPNILILIPMLNEQSIAEDTVKHFARLRYPSNRLRIAFVTTPRERNHRIHGELDTHAVVKRAITNLGEIRHAIDVIDCSGADCCKGDQLNEAIAKFRNEIGHGWPRESTFIGIYDADSRPDLGTLEFLAWRFSEARRQKHRDPVAFQQMVSFFANYGSIPGGIRGWLLRARPWQNLDFALTREIPGFWHQHSSNEGEWFWRSWLHHLLGHGEFIRWDTLDEIGGFQPPSCDTSLGYTLAYLGISVNTIPLFDCGQTPTKFCALLQQNTTWYRGVCLFWRDWRFARSVGSVSLTRAVVMILKRIYNSLSWSVFPAIMTIIPIIAFLTEQYAVLFFWCVGLCFYIAPAAREMVFAPEMALVRQISV